LISFFSLTENDDLILMPTIEDDELSSLPVKSDNIKDLLNSNMRDVHRQV
jgi:hypothetical protein